MGTCSGTSLGRAAPAAPPPPRGARPRARPWPARPCRRRGPATAARGPPPAPAALPPQPPQPQPQPQPLGRRLAAALLAGALALGAPAGLPPLPPPPPAAAVTQEQLLFLEAWRAVDRAYFDKSFNGQNWFKVREDALQKKGAFASRADTHATIRALLKSLDDPYTRFLAPEQLSALRGATRGAVTGVGLEVAFPAAGAAGAGGAGGAPPLVVIAPARGGPAERAGVRPGDRLLAIDGAPTAELSLYAAGAALQGVAGSTVTLTIAPGGGANGSSNNSAAARDVVLAREAIEVDAVDAALCATAGALAPAAPSTDPLGYIRIAAFNKSTVAETAAAVKDLRARGAARLLLDLRDNGGGLFPAGVDVARLFLPRGDVVLIADAAGVRDVYDANGVNGGGSHALEPDAPLALLVNRRTASAAEVLAGALKDNRRAVVAGERTFGKGVIQTLVELADGSAVAVTVARYQTPAGVDINRVGIAPDVAVSAEALAVAPRAGAAFCEWAAGAGAAAPALFGP
jgi:carboxyl-terminal processing protease